MVDHRVIKVIALKSFDRAVKKLLSDDDVKTLSDSLRENPEQGVVIKGTGGVRKMRVALSGRGKRGGARVIYYYVMLKARVFLITAYTKNKKDNLTDAEARDLKRLTDQLKGDT